MKKKTIALMPLLTVLLLSSCGEKNSPTSTGNSISPLPPTSNTTLPPSSPNTSSNEDEEEGVVSTLKALAQGNYTLSYSYSDKEYNDIITPTYSNLGDFGYLLLKDYKDNSKKQVFSYVLKDGEIHLQTGVVDADKNPLRDLSSLDGLSLLKDAKEEDYASFEMEEMGYYKTTNNTITHAFSKLMGMENDFMNADIVGVEFFFDTTELLNFTLLKYNDQNQLVEVDNGKGKFSAIGTSKDSKLESFVSSFAYPKTNLSKEISENLLASSLSTTSTLKMITQTGDKVLSSRTSKVDYDANQLQMEFTQDSSAKYLFIKNDNGIANRAYIDSKTFEVKYTEEGEWTSLSWVKDSFDFSAFKKDTGDTYTYYGSLGNEIVYSLSQMDFNTQIDSLTLNVKDGKVKSLKAISDSMVTTDGDVVRYEMDIVVEDTLRTIKEPELNYDYIPEIYDAFNDLNNAEVSYKATATNDIYNEGNNKISIVNSKVVFLKTTLLALLEPLRGKKDTISPKKAGPNLRLRMEKLPL